MIIARTLSGRPTNIPAEIVVEPTPTLVEVVEVVEPVVLAEEQTETTSEVVEQPTEHHEEVPEVKAHKKQGRPKKAH